MPRLTAGYGIRGAIVVVVAAWVATWSVFGLYEWRANTVAVDLDKRCAVARATGCLARTPGFVTGGYVGEVVVGNADGSGAYRIAMSGSAAPAPGSSVVIERWNAKIVSLFDARTERRFHTAAWPSPNVAVAVAVMCGFFVLFGVSIGVVWLRVERGYRDRPAEARHDGR